MSDSSSSDHKKKKRNKNPQAVAILQPRIRGMKLIRKK